jgi:peroxiredoxin
MRCIHLALLALLPGLLLSAPGAWGADAAPDFSLPDLNGKTVRLSSVYAEGPVVLSFWATWCVPCPEEMKHLQRFYEKYKEKGLTVLAPAIDGSKTVSKVKPFVMGRRFTYPILLDTNSDVKRLYRVAVVPTIFIIDRNGQITYSHVGYRPGDEVELEKAIQKALGEGTGEDKEGQEKGQPEDRPAAATVKEAQEASQPAEGSEETEAPEDTEAPEAADAPEATDAP